jgi:hypothetical protein
MPLTARENGSPAAVTVFGDRDRTAGGGSATIARLNRPVAVAALKSVTLTLIVYEPCEFAGGVPLSSPVGLRVSHAGAPVADQVNPPPAPPIAVNVKE